jgi:RNA polymerase sigma-70 factor (ECF subfamily)
MPTPEHALPGLRHRPDFYTTNWKTISLAGQQEHSSSADAWDELARNYWHPVYCFVRRQGFEPADAADITQDFFGHLLSSDALRSVHRSKGKFRSFLLASLKHHLLNHWNRERRLKRGGAALHLSIDQAEAEHRACFEQSDQLSPDKMFDRRWAETLIRRSLDQLKKECGADDQSRRFDEMKQFLMGEKADGGLAGAAARLGLTLPAVKALARRMRARLNELVRGEIAGTVATREEIEEEIQHLFAALRS